jgi:hypothetical protein
MFKMFITLSLNTLVIPDIKPGLQFKDFLILWIGSLLMETSDVEMESIYIQPQI